MQHGDPIHERYTLWLNADGNPVERTLQEMTGREVMTALQFLAEQCGRLNRETAEVSAVAEAYIKGEIGPDDLSEAEVEVLPANIAALHECAAAHHKQARLLQRVRAAMPQWQNHRKLRLGEAVSRFWPR